MRFLLRSLDQYVEADLEKIKKGIMTADEKVSYKIEEVVAQHQKAIDIPRVGKKPEISPYLRTYKVNL